MPGAGGVRLLAGNMRVTESPCRPITNSSSSASNKLVTSPYFVKLPEEAEGDWKLSVLRDTYPITVGVFNFHEGRRRRFRVIWHLHRVELVHPEDVAVSWTPLNHCLHNELDLLFTR